MSEPVKQPTRPTKDPIRLASPPEVGTMVRLASSNTVGVVAAVVDNIAMVNWPGYDRAHIHRWQYLVEIPSTTPEDPAGDDSALESGTRV